LSTAVEMAVSALNERLGGEGIDGSVRFVIAGEGTVRIDRQGASADDADADCTLYASADTFERMLGGDLNPAAAFMNGSLRVEGDMGLAMRLGSLLS
jgi:putative sterol carrier protein